MPTKYRNIGHRGWGLYAKIMRHLHDKPQTAREVYETLGMTKDNALDILRGMVRLGLLHVSEWATVGPRNAKAAVYAYGPGENAPSPRTAWPVSRRPVKHELLAFADLVAALTQGATMADVMEEVGCSRNQAWRFMKYGREIGFTHIHSYIRRGHGGSCSAVYRIGIDKRDAPRPKPKTQAELDLAWKARKAQRAILAPLYKVAANDQAKEAA